MRRLPRQRQIRTGQLLLYAITGVIISLLYRPYALGNVDNSGKIDATDTFYLMYYIALRAVGQEPPAEVVPEACDIDKNGTVDSTDLFYLMVYIAYGGAGMPLTFDQIVSGNF